MCSGRTPWSPDSYRANWAHPGIWLLNLASALGLSRKQTVSGKRRDAHTEIVKTRSLFDPVDNAVFLHTRQESTRQGVFSLKSEALEGHSSMSS